MRKEVIYKDDPKRYNWFLRIIQGIFIGAFSMIPFSHQRNLEECIKTDDRVFKNGFVSYRRRWAYVLGMILGVILFAFIPLRFLIPNFPFALYTGLAVFTLGSIVYEIYRMFTLKEKTSIALMILALIVGVGAVIATRYFNLSKLTSFTGGVEVVYLFLILTIGSFISTYSGMGLGTFFLMSGSYMAMYESFDSLAYLKNFRLGLQSFKETKSFSNLFSIIQNDTIVLLVLILSIFIGSFLGFILRNKPNRERVKSSLNLGIYIPLVAFFIKDKVIGQPMYTEVVKSTIAQLITNISVILIFLVVPFVLSIHGYRFLNKEKRELAFNKQEEYEEVTIYSSEELNKMLTDGVLEDINKEENSEA